MSARAGTWRERKPAVRAGSEGALKGRIRAIHARSRGSDGVPRIQAELAAEGTGVSIKRVAGLMRELGAAGESRRKGPPTTRRNRQARPAPDQLWVADITHLPTWVGFV